jgi:microcin C transport system substrate-binding protein
MPAKPCPKFLFRVFLFFAAAISFSTEPAYAISLIDPLPVKQAPSPNADSVKTHLVHTLTVLDEPKYPDHFAHFNYANPNAPKGGTIHTAEVGTFNNLAPFIIQRSSLQVWLVYEQLFSSPRDDLLSSYPLVAESAEIAEDKSFVIFHLNPMARWQDGLLVTSDDVVFTFNTLRNHEKANPYFRSVYQEVKAVEALDQHQVKFQLSPESSSNLPFLIASMHILPAHFYTKHQFGNTSLEPPVGSGPYRIGEIFPGRRIVYERVPDYWARDLPTRRGLYNFDRWIVDYYRDTNAKAQAFEAGLSDMVVEYNPARWLAYDSIPEKAERRLVRVESRLQGALGSMNFAFNLRRQPFDNMLVREAITQLFDFEWINRVLLGGWAERNYSLFPNSELAARGPPSAAERELLLPWKGKIRNEALDEQFIPPISDGSGYQRQQRRKAFELFAKAGYSLHGGVLVSGTGEPLSIEIITASADFQNALLAFVTSLRRAGIDARLRIIDTPQFERRVRVDHDFDMTFQYMGTTDIPGQEQELHWGSRFADKRYTVNVPGVQDAVADDLVGRIGCATSRKQLIAAARALDRVVAWNSYLLPGWYMAFVHYAYWDRFGRANDGIGQENGHALGPPDVEAWWVK